MLQSQRKRSAGEQMEEVNQVMRNYEKLEARVQSLKDELNAKEVSS